MRWWKTAESSVRDRQLEMRSPDSLLSLEGENAPLIAKDGRFQPAPILAASASMLCRLRDGRLVQRDVKNEDRSGDMYENKGVSDTITDN